MTPQRPGALTPLPPPPPPGSGPATQYAPGYIPPAPPGVNPYTQGPDGMYVGRNGTPTSLPQPLVDALAPTYGGMPPSFGQWMGAGSPLGAPVKPPADPADPTDDGGGHHHHNGGGGGGGGGGRHHPHYNVTNHPNAVANHPNQYANHPNWFTNVPAPAADNPFAGTPQQAVGGATGRQRPRRRR